VTLQPFLVLRFPEPLTEEQEAILISYFQAWQRQFTGVFSRTAKALKASSYVPGSSPLAVDMAENYEIASKSPHSILQLEDYGKPNPTEFTVLFNEVIIQGAQLPLPKAIREKMRLRPEDQLEKLKTRMRMNLTGEVARKMKVAYVEVSDP